MAAQLDIRLLGPIEVNLETRPVDVGPTQARAVLAALALSAGRAVSVDHLIDSLWPGDPPTTARKSIQKHISTLRASLGSSTVETTKGGYRLHAEEDAVDVHRFERMVATALNLSDAPAALDRLDAALDLWRGDPFGSVGTLDGFRGDRTHMEELRLLAIEKQAELRLRLGAPEAMVGPLEDLVARHPLREGLWALLMKALYRSGRQAEALRAYRRLRSVLVEELGVEPSVDLRDLELRILDHDPSLDWPVEGVERVQTEEVGSASAVPAPTEPTFSGPERRVITVMLVELGDPVAAIEGNDPEDIDHRLAPYREAIRNAVERYGGEVDSLLEDRMRAVFGLIAHEDDPERAVRAALRIQDAVVRRHEANPDLRMDVKVTVDTGLALVDPTAEGSLRLVGEVLNTVGRLQEMARPGDVLVGSATHSATDRVADFEGPGQIESEGQPPIEAWRAVAVRSRTGGDEPPPTPFVGRALELAQLEEVFARAVQDESPHLVTITGEPGVGKTRVIRQFQMRLEQSPVLVAWREGRCLPYGEGITLFALSGIVKAHTGILDSDPADRARTKLRDAIEVLDLPSEERDWLLTRIQPLVGISEPALEAAGREELVRAWGRFIEALADRYPLVAVFEDVHWADDVVLGFIEHLIDELVRAPLLVLCTARPELFDAHPTWAGGKRNATAMALPSLSDPDSTDLLEELLSGAGVDPGTQDAIRDRSGGNPLYLTEYARMVLEDGGRPEEVPASLQALITARLDLLPEEERTLLQAASVIGERFWLGAVSHLLGLRSGEARELMKRLVRRGLMRPLRQSLFAGEEELSFEHVLVRDITYGLLARRPRRRMHHAAADWLETKAGERLADVAEILAYHGEQAMTLDAVFGESDESLRQRTVDWLITAGDRARNLDQETAIGFFRRAVDRLEAPSVRLGQALMGLGMTLVDAWRLDEAEKILSEARDVYQSADDPLGEVMTRTELAKALWFKGETDAANEERERSYQQAKPYGPSRELAHAVVQRAAGRALGGDAERAVAYFEEALPLAESHGSVEDRIRAYSMRGVARVDLGDDGGLRDLEHSVELAETAGLTRFTAVALNNLGQALWMHEGPRRAIPPLERGIEIAERRGLVSQAEWVRHTMVEILVDQGDWDRAQEQAEALLAREGERAASQIRAIEIELARIVYWRGDVEEANELRRHYVPFARTARDLQHLAPGLALAAAIACEVGEPDEASELIDEFHEVAAELPYYRASELSDIARTSVALGDVTIARSLAGREPEHPAKAQAGLVTAQALLAEYDGELDRAVERFDDAMARWDRFGHPLEHGLAMFGGARVALSRGDEKRTQQLSMRARARFDDLGAVTALRQIERWAHAQVI